MMSSSKKIFSSAGIVASSTFLSRILGLVRDAVIAAYLGTSASADAFFVAFRIPNLFRRLLAEGSLITAYVPVFTDILKNQGKDEAFSFAEASFKFFSMFLFLLTLICIAGSPLIIKATAPGFFDNPQKAELAVILTRIMFPYLFFICLVALCMGILNSLEHFAAPAIAPVFLNLCMISSVVLFASFFKDPVFALALGVIAGGFVQLMIQFPFLFKKGINPFRGKKLWHPEIKKVAALMGPTLFGSAVYQLSILINTILASLMPEGSVSYLYFADRLVQFPLGVFGITAGVVVLPLMSRQVAEKNIDDVRQTLTKGLCFIFFISIPSTIGLIVLGKPIISLLFMRKAFTIEMVDATYLALICYSVGLFAASGIRILVSFFYSFKDAKIPVKAGVLGFGTNIILAVVLMNFISYSGLALAVSIGTIVNLIFLLMNAGKKVYNINWFFIFKRVCLIILGSAIMGVLVYYLDLYLGYNLPGGFLFLLIRVLSGVSFGALCYFVFSWLFRLPEITTIKSVLRRNS